MASDEVQLLTFWSSPFTMRAELALTYKGVCYTKVPTDPQARDSLLLQYNPVYKKIPVLIHHGKSVCESAIIVQYVNEAFPSPDGKDLFPKDPLGRANARFWGDFVDKKIFDAFVRAVRSTGDVQKAAVVEVKENLSILDEAFKSKEPPYFGGAEVGYVDIMLAPLAVWYEAFETLCNCELELEKLPRLAGWRKAMRECSLGQTMPEVQKVTEFATTMLKKRLEAAQAEAQP